MKKRILTVFLICSTLGAALLGRIFYIQVIKDDRLAALARRQFNSKILVSARRGAIVDRNGEALAINTDAFSLAANPKKIANRALTSKLLAKSLNLGKQKISDRLKEKRDFIWIKRHVTENEIEQMKKWGLSDRYGNLPEGLWIVKENHRTYPHGTLASQIVGTVNIDNEGVEGIELSQNKRLEGKGVSVSAIKDALGRPAFYDTVAAQDARDGEEIQLTIDASLQFSVEEELKSSLEKTRARSGIVIVMDAVNGDILALAHGPSYNPNQREIRGEIRRNRSITDGYEPGSTIKPLILAGALERGYKITDQFYGEKGSFKVQGRRISEAETHEKFEWMTLDKMVRVSSNVVAAKLAMKLGQGNLVDIFSKFGFGGRTGISFPGELAGWLPSKKGKPLQPLTLATMGFGHGLMVTPMQIARSYAALANGGYLVTPRLLKNPRKEEEPKAPVQILQPETVRLVTDAMKSVTEKDGTGKKAALDGYVVAGKTGTAQTVDEKTKRYSQSRYISSFAGFPVGVSPKLVILAILDEPSKPTYYASETAAPLFREVLNAAVTRYAIPSVRELEIRPLAARHENQKKKKEEPITLTQAHPEPAPEALELLGTTPQGKKVWKMPSLRGLTVQEASQLFEDAKISIRTQGAGVVEEQSPSVEHKLTEGETVSLKLGL